MSFLAAGERIIAGAAAGLYKAGTTVLARSQPLVPVASGTLKRSGLVEEPVVDGDVMSVTVGYGYGTEYEDKAGEESGPGYGVYVHERLDVNHPHGQAKFLEQPAREFEPEFAPMVEAAIREKL